MLQKLFDAAIKFSKKIVALMFIETAVFTVAMIVTYYITGGVPDVLVENFFGFFKIEGGVLSLITVADKFVSWLNNNNDSEKKSDEQIIPRAE